MKQKSMMDITYREFFAWLRFRLSQDIEGHIEKFLCNQQWYRKHKGGKWELRCYEKQVSWSPANSFVDIMARLGEIVDVLKVEDWTNG